MHEFFAGKLAKLKISFLDPGEYFGSTWKIDFERAGYSTAVCGRIGNWDDETGDVSYFGHLIHLIKDEPDGVRMRSRFWLGDVPGLLLSPEEKKASVPRELAFGLLQHATEEMAILATILPDLYEQHARK